MLMSNYQTLRGLVYRKLRLCRKIFLLPLLLDKQVVMKVVWQSIFLGVKGS